MIPPWWSNAGSAPTFVTQQILPQLSLEYRVFFVCFFLPGTMLVKPVVAAVNAMTSIKTESRLNPSPILINPAESVSIWKEEALIHEGQGWVDVVREETALRFSLHYLFSILGVVWPSPVMRSGVTVCLESRGNASPPCPRITAQPRRPRHSRCLFRLHLDCKSRALLTHLRVSPRG